MYLQRRRRTRETPKTSTRATETQSRQTSAQADTDTYKPKAGLTNRRTTEHPALANQTAQPGLRATSHKHKSANRDNMHYPRRTTAKATITVCERHNHLVTRHLRSTQRRTTRKKKRTCEKYASHQHQPPKVRRQRTRTQASKQTSWPSLAAE